MFSAEIKMRQYRNYLLIHIPLVALSFAVIAAGQEKATPSAAWKLVRSVVQDSTGSTQDYVLVPQKEEGNRALYEQAANTVCAGRTSCSVFFWTDISRVPETATFPGISLRFMTATYERSPSYEHPHLGMACWLYPNGKNETENCFSFSSRDRRNERPELHKDPVPNHQTTNGGMMYLLTAAAVFGFLGIGAGFFSLRQNWRLSVSTDGAISRKWVVILLVVGALVGIGTWPATYFMGYPVRVGNEVWRIVGIPFPAAFFDTSGADYVGWFTMPAVLGNGLFWFLLPQTTIYFKWNNARRSIAS